MNWASYLVDIIGNSLGVAAGIVAGIKAYYMFEAKKKQDEQQREKEILTKEFELNIQILSDFIDELNRWRKAVNEGTILRYFGYFSLTRMFASASYRLINSGYLFQLLSYEDILVLQRMFTLEYTPASEQMINQQIQDQKTAYQQRKEDNNLNDWFGEDKPLAIEQIDIWQSKFSEQIESFKTLMAHLSES